MNVDADAILTPYRDYAGLKLTQVFYLTCLIFRQVDRLKKTDTMKRHFKLLSSIVALAIVLQNQPVTGC